MTIDGHHIKGFAKVHRSSQSDTRWKDPLVELNVNLLLLDQSLLGSPGREDHTQQYNK